MERVLKPESSFGLTNPAASRGSCIPGPHKPGGFSLVELLIVIGIVGLLLTLGTMGIRSVLSGGELRQAAGMVVDMIARARQLASAQGEAVEVRFYEENRDGVVVWSAVQLWTRKPGSSDMIEASRFERLPGSVVMDATRSPLLAGGGVSGPGVGEATTRTNRYQGFQFRPDGSLRGGLSVNSSFLTLLRQQELGGEIPPNFIVIQVDPHTGRVESFQP